MKFIDEVNITLASGRGGPGCVSFRRESMQARGGPDGGNGGKGGSVVIRTSRHINSLVDIRRNKKYSAQSGQMGMGRQKSGQDGEDFVLVVPEGTVLRNLEGEIVVDMTGISEYTLLKGGRGGMGNEFFKNSVNQAPEYAQPGEEGEELEVKLELKLIADVGIVGFPNAGKSTLISRISAAKPKIADYPFTTLTPNLGVVKAGDYSSFVVADIPGLVKGAHSGVGLGIQFLKHIERTRLFIHLIDASGMSGRDPLDDYNDINNELKMYDETNSDKEGFFPLATRPQFVVLNKIDTLSEKQLHKLKQKFKEASGQEPYAISAVTGTNIKEFIQELARQILVEKEEEQT
ncbi:GTPase ObgE [Bdellovibrio bacteriovorus]|uniref:GTPase Obg n=1 Tax=Bdellovibrio bacteriovorus TaxID=959 RepID=A0A150WQS2_BDEBC|nr:GTPase ObgE [Bdellovibrio bacteriovorus]KYG66649.1 GTPase ObgE [Bdellovibrio bacteriovorus]